MLSVMDMKYLILRRFWYREEGMGLERSQKNLETLKNGSKNASKLPNLFSPLLVKHPTLGQCQNTAKYTQETTLLPSKTY